jgi:uncharacterized protein YfbU (UPF0304 family)
LTCRALGSVLTPLHQVMKKPTETGKKQQKTRKRLTEFCGHDIKKHTAVNDYVKFVFLHH